MLEANGSSSLHGRLLGLMYKELQAALDTGCEEAEPSFSDDTSQPQSNGAPGSAATPLLKETGRTPSHLMEANSADSERRGDKAQDAADFLDMDDGSSCIRV